MRNLYAGFILFLVGCTTVSPGPSTSGSQTHSQERLAGYSLDPSPSPSTSSLPAPNVSSSPILKENPPVGINLEGLSYYARSQMFCDAFKTSSAWGSSATPWDGKSPPVDSNGWPLGDFGTMAFTDMPSGLGTYQLSFTGKATVKAVASNATIGAMTYDPIAGISSFTVTVLGNQLALSFSGTSQPSGGGIANIRLLRPGCDPQVVFNPKFLELLKPFSVIRFMDFTFTNNNPVVKWSERTTPESAHQSGVKGGAWEYAIDLANQTGKDMWINIPHMADDDYVKNLAQLIKCRLNWDRKVYLEYSNEVWNGQFKQYYWNKAQAQAEVAAGDTTYKDSATDTSDEYWAWKRVAKRLLSVSAVFKSALGPDRVRPILAHQISNPSTFRKALLYVEKYYGAPKDVIYGIAGAPYFSTKEGNNPNLTQASLLKGLMDSVNGYPKIWSDGKWDGKGYACANGSWDGVTNCYTFGSLAKWYGLRKLSYEIGPDTFGAAGLPTKILVNNSPEMGALVQAHFAKWFGCGGDLANYFALTGKQSQYGSWAAVENISAPGTEKYKAIQAVSEMDLNQLRAQGCVLPSPSPSPSPSVSASVIPK